MCRFVHVGEAGGASDPASVISLRGAVDNAELALTMPAERQSIARQETKVCIPVDASRSATALHKRTAQSAATKKN